VIARVVLVLCLAVALVGCGDTKGDEKAPVRVYFLHDGKVWPVARTIGAGFDLGDEALRVLQDGPTQAERDLGLTTEVPENASGPATDAARAQVVYTGTQFARRAVDIDGKRYTRADFEEQTPAILVESPLAFQGAQTPLRVTGTANTFEATFEYELRDSVGKVVDSNFVTATSGTGTRGTFDFTTKAADDAATLVVFERSAKDGSRINEVDIPLEAR